jgi:ABC-2 type transport system ATP-binding protein
MLELAKMGKTIFFSTHILADVAEICTRVGIIEDGTMVATGGIEDLQKLVMPHKQVELAVLDSFETVASLLAGREGVDGVSALPAAEENRTRLGFSFAGDDAALGDLLAFLVKNKARVVQFKEESRNLEEVFMRITKGVVS